MIEKPVKLSEIVPGLRRKLDDMPFMGLARPKNEGEPFYVDPLDELAVSASERYVFGYHDWRGIWGSFEDIKERYAAEVFNAGTTFGAPHVWIPKAPLLVAAAAAVAIVKNPVVTRRFWAGWGKNLK